MTMNKWIYRYVISLALMEGFVIAAHWLMVPKGSQISDFVFLTFTAVAAFVFAPMLAQLLKPTPPVVPITLEQAIGWCKRRAEIGTGQHCSDFTQLTDWLLELKKLREEPMAPPELTVEGALNAIKEVRLIPWDVPTGVGVELTLGGGKKVCKPATVVMPGLVIAHLSDVGVVEVAEKPDTTFTCPKCQCHCYAIEQSGDSRVYCTDCGWHLSDDESQQFIKKLMAAGINPSPEAACQ